MEASCSWLWWGSVDSPHICNGFPSPIQFLPLDAVADSSKPVLLQTRFAGSLLLCPWSCCRFLQCADNSASLRWEHGTSGSGYYDPLKTEKLQGKTGREAASEQLKTKLLLGSKTNQPTQTQHVHDELGKLQQRDSRGIF